MNKQNWLLKLKKDPVKPIFIIIGLAILAYVSFYYLKLTHFPIGDDPAHHISQAMRILDPKTVFRQITHSFYPICNILFAFVKILSFQAWPIAFIITISLFLFFTCLALFYFVFKVTKDARIGIAVAIILSSSRWLFDNIRTGLLAEVLAWGFFILTSYFFVKRNLVWSLILLVLLAFSHPLVFAVTLMIFLCYSMVLLTDLNKEKAVFLIRFWLITAVLLLINYLVLPSKIEVFSILAKTSGLVGARPLKIIFTEEVFLRFMVYIMGTIGVIFSLKHWKKDYIKYFLTLLVVSILMVLSYQWGLKFYVFRFYTYLEIAFAFFSGYGIVNLIDYLPKFKFLPAGRQDSNIPYYLILLFFIIILIIPNIRANTAITNWQKSDIYALAILPEQDRITLDWAKNNLPKDSVFVSPTRWGTWIRPLTGFENHELDYLFETNKIDSVYKKMKKIKADYFFLSQINRKRAIEDPAWDMYFEKIYNNEQSRIYRVK